MYHLSSCHSWHLRSRELKWTESYWSHFQGSHHGSHLLYDCCTYVPESSLHLQQHTCPLRYWKMSLFKILNCPLRYWKMSLSLTPVPNHDQARCIERLNLSALINISKYTHSVAEQLQHQHHHHHHHHHHLHYNYIIFFVSRHLLPLQLRYYTTLHNTYELQYTIHDNNKNILIIHIDTIR